MKFAFININRVMVFSLTVYLLITLSGGLLNIIAQDINPSAKKKSDFISQEEKEFLKIKQLKVKTRTKYSLTSYGKDQKDQKKIVITIESFNKKGLLTEITEKNSRGNIVSYYSFEYDSKGRPIKAEGEDASGKSFTQISKYDSRGNELERKLITVARRTSENKTLMAYDKSGNLTEVSNYENGKLSDRQFITYENGLRKRTIYLDKEGDTVLVSVPEYNSSGKLLKDERKDKNGVGITYIYKYDSDGNLSEMIDNETRRNYTSDEKGNAIEYKMYLLDGRRQIRLVFKYAPNGLQSDQIRYDNSEIEVLHMIYEYEYYK